MRFAKDIAIIQLIVIIIAKITINCGSYCNISNNCDSNYSIKINCDLYCKFAFNLIAFLIANLRNITTCCNELCSSPA